MQMLFLGEVIFFHRTLTWGEKKENEKSNHEETMRKLYKIVSAMFYLFKS